MGKRKAPAEKASKREKKAKKDPNKPKRPPSAFFVFLLVILNFHFFFCFFLYSVLKFILLGFFCFREDFRTTFKKENPNVKAVSAVSIWQIPCTYILKS